MLDQSVTVPTASEHLVGGRLDVRLDTSLELLLAKMPADDTRKVLATVVSTAGSTYRKPGARMLIMSDGSFLGLLSGGCLEGDLELHAQEVMDSGLPRAVEYDMRGPDDVLFGIGTGCEGAMRVLLEPAGPQSRALAALKAAGEATRAGKSTALIVVHASADAALGTYRIERSLPAGLIHAARDVLDSASSKGVHLGMSDEAGQAFVQYLAPPPHVLICGAGPDAQPVASSALALGWRVTLVDHRPDYADPRRFPGATVLLADARAVRTVVDVQACHAAVVMSHHLHSDAIYLRELAEAGAPAYVGLLGPAARRQRLVGELGVVFDQLKDRLRGPVGLDLGAVTPEGIALAIVSQIHAWLAQSEPAQNRPLSRRGAAFAPKT